MLLFTQTSFAQQDSLSKYSFDAILSQYNQIIINDIGLLSFIPYQGLGKAAISYQYFNGGLKPIQEADQLNNFRFESYGAKTINKFTLAGGFSYNRQLADSVRWNHRDGLNDSSPYYFASKAGTNYDRINYELNVISNYQISKKIGAGLGAEYYTGSSFSSNDPRGKLDPFKLNFQANINYQITKNGYLNTTINYGYGNNDIDIDYKNRVYFESLAYPQYITYLNYGLGYVTVQSGTSKRRMVQEYIYKGVELDYIKSSNSAFYRIKFGYQNKFENTRLGDKTSIDERQPIGNFKDDKFYFDAFFLLRENLLVQFKANHETGRDENALFSGSNNFVSEHNNIDANVLKSFGMKNKQHTIGLNLAYADDYKADGSSATSLNNAYIVGGLSYQKAFFKKDQNYNVGISSSYKKPLFSDIGYSVNNINPFINDVVFNDYHYNELDILKTGIFVSTLQRFKNFMPVKISANLSYSNTFKNNQFNTFGTPIRNWEFGLSLAIIVN